MIEVGNKVVGAINQANYTDAIEFGLKACEEQKKKSGKPWGCCEIAYTVYDLNPMDITRNGNRIFMEGGLFYPCIACAGVIQDLEKRKNAGPSLWKSPTPPSSTPADQLHDEFYSELCGKKTSEMKPDEREQCEKTLNGLRQAGRLTQKRTYRDL